MGSRRQPREAGKSPLNALERMDWEWIELGALTEDPRLQMRIEGLDEKHVRDLMATIEDKGIDDPITVIREGKTHWLGDGFHRVEAMRRVAGEQWQKQEIKAIVLTGTFDDAKQIARKANLRHGRALSSASRKAILFDMLRNNEEINGIAVKRLSNGVLAAELGVHADTISEWFKELIAESSTNGNPLVVLEDRQSVYSRDGKLRDVTGIQEKQQERAAELAERRAAEEAERKRNLPALDKMRVITQYLISKYRDSQAKKGKPLFDDPDKGFKWCFQVSNPVFVVDIDWEHQFLREYGAKPVGLYREFLRLADQAIFTEADMDGWSDEALADWLTAMKQRPPRQPNATTETFHQTGMAQPKNPNLKYQPPTPTGRHRSTEVTATESEHHTEPTYDCPLVVGQRIMVLATGEVTRVGAVEWVDVEWRLRSTSFPDHVLLLTDVDAVPECPFAVGQNVEVFESGEKGVVQRLQYINNEWRIHVTLYDGPHVFKVDALQRIFAEVVEEAMEKPYDPQPGDDGTCPYVIGQDVLVIATGEVYTVASISFHGNEWRVYVEGENDYATLDQLSPYIAPPSVEQAFSRPDNGNGHESHEPTDEIAALRMAMNNLKAAATELQRTEVTTLRLLAPKIKEVYIRDLREVDDYVHSVVMAVTQLIGRAVNA
ncbi:MAG: ParB/RepB/Spo0J family partition protein [Anaerolineae bacterium]|nr:ParB/RepB/Spo0J family partition protein [Anaerolineae bacterium]